MAIRPSKSFALARSGCWATKSITLDCRASKPSIVSSCFADRYKEYMYGDIYEGVYMKGA